MDVGLTGGDETAIGAQFGKYRVVRRLGEGAFGAVYEALLPGPMGFSKRVAIKKIRSSLVRQDPRFVQSMINEARIGGLLHHANIVDVLEFDQVGEHYFIAMEFVDGPTLAQALEACKSRKVLLPRFAMVDIAMQICRGLHYAHTFRDPDGAELGLVHRDLKPSNIILDAHGVAKILDFGIAKAASNLFHTTESATVKGTPRYMSPEQIAAEGGLSPRSDLYSLGVVLFELITGRVLFDADSFPALVHRIVYEDSTARLDDAEVAFPGSRALLERALHKDPADRFADALEMSAALRELGRRYPAEAEMSEVVGRLLPAVDRSETVEIRDSADLDLGSSIPAADTAMDDLSEHTPIPPADPTSAGWDRFSAVFSAPGSAPDAPAKLAVPGSGEKTGSGQRPPSWTSPSTHAAAPLAGVEAAPAPPRPRPRWGAVLAGVAVLAAAVAGAYALWWAPGAPLGGDGGTAGTATSPVAVIDAVPVEPPAFVDPGDEPLLGTWSVAHPPGATSTVVLERGAGWDHERSLDYPFGERSHAATMTVYDEAGQVVIRQQIKAQNPYPAHDWHLELRLRKVVLWGDSVVFLLAGSVHVWAPSALISLAWDGELAGPPVASSAFWHPGSIYPVEVLAEGPRGGPAIIAGAMNNALGGRGAVMALGLVGADGEAPPFYGNPAGRNIGLYWYRVAGKDQRDFLALDTAGGDITVRFQGASELRLDRYGQPRDAADGAGGEATAAQRWEAEQESLERFRAAIDRLQRDPEAWQREFDELWALVEEHGWEGYEEALVVLESDFLVRHDDRIQALGRLTAKVGDSGDFPLAQQQVMRLMFDPTNPVDALNYWRRHAQQDANEWPRTVEARYLLLARQEDEADALIGTITDADVTRAASESDACWWRGDLDCLQRLAESNRGRFGNSPGFLRPLLRAAVWTDEDHSGYLPYTAGAIDACSPPLGHAERLAYLEWTLIRARLQLRGDAGGAEDALRTLDGVAGELDEFVSAYREHQELRAMVAITRAEAAAALGQGPRACDELRAVLAAPAAVPPWLVARGQAASADLGCSH